jgi:PD-(D/E)XK nuclease superfamily
MGNYTKRGSYYWLGDVPYVSVTEVLKVLDKPALQRWYGKQVYLAMLANPALSESEALAAPYKISDDAKARGTTIHDIVEAWQHNQTYIDGIPEKYRGYATAFYRWVEDYDATLVEHERSVASRKYGYAGTLDLLVTLNGSGKLVLIDVKTGKDVYVEALLQTSAYRQAIKEEGVEVVGTGVLVLADDGTYKFQRSEADLFRQFFACKVLWDFLNSEEVTQLRKYTQGGPHG